MSTFYTIPVEVQAVEILVENESELATLVDGFSDEDGKVHRLPSDGPFEGLIIPTPPDGFREPDGRIRMFGRDLYSGWLVKDSYGNFSHYTDMDFKKTFYIPSPEVPKV